MTMFLITALVFVLFVAFMSVGVIFSNREIKGSCGGLNNISDDKGNPFCEVCGLPAGQTCGDEEQSGVEA